MFIKLVKLFIIYFIISTITLVIYDLIIHNTLITNYNVINDLRITIPISLVCSIAQLKK